MILKVDDGQRLKHSGGSRLVTERSWVRILPGAGLFSSLFFILPGPSQRFNTTDFPTKVRLAMQLEAKQA